jgi:hypothetical protein
MLIVNFSTKVKRRCSGESTVSSINGVGTGEYAHAKE